MHSIKDWKGNKRHGVMELSGSFFFQNVNDFIISPKTNSIILLSQQSWSDK